MALWSGCEAWRVQIHRTGRSREVYELQASWLGRCVVCLSLIYVRRSLDLSNTFARPHRRSFDMLLQIKWPLIQLCFAKHNFLALFYLDLFPASSSSLHWNAQRGGWRSRAYITWYAHLDILSWNSSSAMHYSSVSL